ncbi:fluoride efflux transporter FluC [Microbacterium sp. No. 7]|uniref:fluoride efflux transporter FluC n=1 Tax=Microbacterium sp. No. 7 TaxID=1714373 RepID=UPI0006ECDD9F|nr:CrcB family protein [Microbacterium sp. No. 7]ALJ22129.1 CrcB-like protein [Microbacterium sp. No. 7]
MVTSRWFSPVVLLLVMAGGAIGVAARAALTLPFAPALAPAITMGINIAGSLLLGVIVGWLDDRHPRLRMFLGTGIMGGFTTYSAFAVYSASGGDVVSALALTLVSVLGGVLAALVGLMIGRRIADVPGEIERAEDAE